MNLVSIASSFPLTRFSQAECLAALRESDYWKRLSSRSLKILERVLRGDSGIDFRHFAVDSLEQTWRRDAQELSEAYEREAPRLGGAAVQKALARASLSPTDVDILLVSSCTGYLCPGLSTHMGEQLGLRPDAVLQDLTGHGCGAAVPLMQLAAAFSAMYPEACIVTAEVEVCSAAFYLDDDVGVLISACLFGDGASAQVWSDQSGAYRAEGFDSIHRPDRRADLRFINSGGRLKNQLRKTLPGIVAESVESLAAKKPLRAKETPVLHGGGRDVLDALEPVFPERSLEISRQVLRSYGNLSSPSMFLALERQLEEADSEWDSFWLCGFGAGFSAHSARLARVA
jgi:alkylresorcinol/alkylpyrone synthase